MTQDPFFQAFGFTWQALVAYAGLHFHLWLIGRRLTRVEATPTVSTELAAQSNPNT